jgi:hypothetical protein
MFFPQCQTPSTTPILNNAELFLPFDLSILRQKTGRQKILEEMITDISRIYSAVRYILIKILISLDIHFYYTI